MKDSPDTGESFSVVGIGASAGGLEAIFDAFEQGRRRLSDPTQGVGLGLSISRSLARAMGGDVTVESTVGAGSTFTLTLARAPSRNIRATGEADTHPGQEAEP